MKQKVLSIRQAQFSGDPFQLNDSGVCVLLLNAFCRAGSVTFTLPFWWSHGRILLSRDTFEQIIRERGVSWLSCFYWQGTSAASDSRDSSAPSSSPPDAADAPQPGRIPSASSGRTPGGVRDRRRSKQGAEKQEVALSLQEPP